MDPSVAGLIGVGIGAIASLLGALISNWLLVRSQKEQWLREIKAEKERWLRERLQEIYENCIYYAGASSHIYIPDNLQKESNIEYQKLEFERLKLQNAFSAERQKWLNLLLTYHPFKETADYRDFVEKIREHKIRPIDVIELASSDPRLRFDLPKDNEKHNRVE